MNQTKHVVKMKVANTWEIALTIESIVDGEYVQVPEEFLSPEEAEAALTEHALNMLGANMEFDRKQFRIDAVEAPSVATA